VGEGTKLPIGGRVAIDRRRLLDLIDQMRVAVPAELREAQEVLSQKEEVLAGSREESQLMIARAQQEVEERLRDNEIVRAAQGRSDEIIRRAEEQADALIKDAEERMRARLSQAESVAAQQMDEADRYALEMLKKLESQLSAFLASVRAGIESMENKTQVRT
jgi:cell division septum initiation protein DivIVA